MEQQQLRRGVRHGGPRRLRRHCLATIAAATAILSMVAWAAFIANAFVVPVHAAYAQDPSSIAISPSSLSGTVGAQQCLSALVQGYVVTPVPGDVPVPGVSVVFTVTGMNAVSRTVVTGSDGKASFCYTPSKPGADLVQAFADSNGDGYQNTAEPVASIDGLYTAQDAPLAGWGKLRAWGLSSLGQLGDGGGYPRGSGSWPSQVHQISAGARHTMVLAQDGTVWTSGYTGYAQAGWNVLGAGCDGYDPCNPWPVQMLKNIMPLSDPPPTLYPLRRVTSVSAGGNHSLALDQDGTVWAWGSNVDGQLGNAAGVTARCYVGSVTRPCRFEPLPVQGLLEYRTVGGVLQPANTYVKQIVAGGDFSLVLKDTNQVWGWGNFRASYYGSGQSISSPVPVAIPGLTNVRQIAAGPTFGLAVKFDGTVWAWGRSDFALGGYRTYADYPEQVVGLTDIVFVAAGNAHSVALRSDGTVWAWGVDSLGQVGTGVNNVVVRDPEQVGGSTPITDVVAIAAGGDSSFAIKSDRTLWGWGSNRAGQIGASTGSCLYGNTFVSCADLPVRVPGVSGVFRTSSGYGFTLAVVQDDVAPTTTAVVAPTPNAEGWNRVDATVTLTATDDSGGSGVQTITYGATGAQPIASTTVNAATATATIDAEGATTLGFSATDNTGNAEPAKSLLVRVDKTAPTGIAALADRAPDRGTWYRSRIVISFTGHDSVSGMASCTKTSYEGPDGAGVSVTGVCRDIAGNEASSQFSFSFDATPPVITASRNPLPNAFGWTSSDVTVSFTCSDATSGIDQCPPDSQIVSTEGASQSVTGTAVDAAGNVGSATQSDINIDKTSPSVTCAVADGAWHGNDVILDCHATDSLSGLAAAGDVNFALSTAVPAGSETDDAPTDARLVHDRAGNTAAAGPIGGNKVDKKSPSITVVTPAAVSYTIGQPVASAYTCSDNGSGVAECIGTVPSGSTIDTATPGAYVFNVASRDQVGNQAQAQVSYLVAYGVCPLYDQGKIKNDGAVFPITIAVCDVSGRNLSRPDLAVVASGVIRLSDGAPVPLISPGRTNAGGAFSFDPLLAPGGAYLLNFDTDGLTTGSYAVIFRISGDGTDHQVLFAVR